MINTRGGNQRAAIFVVLGSLKAIESNETVLGLEDIMNVKMISEKRVNG